LYERLEMIIVCFAIFCVMSWIITFLEANTVEGQILGVKKARRYHALQKQTALTVTEVLELRAMQNKMCARKGTFNPAF